jgi:alpha/beta superfamily hydrolase
VEAVCRYALTQLEEPPARLVVIGYSHGSVVASAVAGEMPEVMAYAAIAYPFSVAWALTLFHQGSFLAAASQGSKPKLFVMVRIALFQVLRVGGSFN